MHAEKVRQGITEDSAGQELRGRSVGASAALQVYPAYYAGEGAFTAFAV